MPLNTGYDHGSNTLYPIGAADNYWIKIASYEPPAPAVAVAPARVVNLGSPWGTIAGARWIAPRLSSASTSGTNHGRPAYSIYRKCFCLLEGYANPTLSVAVRADDYVQVWLNNVTNTIVGPTMGNYFSSQGGPHQGVAKPDHFRVGRNCIYVLVEDVTGNVAFTLAGSVNAAGLMPIPAIGNNGNFGPCGCPSEPNSADGSPGSPTASNGNEAELAIDRSAEERRHGGAPTNRN
jgi:hypothetical protein